MNMTPTTQESEIRNNSCALATLLAKSKKTNPRKKFASYLRKLSDWSLLARHQQTMSNYKVARERGECSLEAFLYFDLAQISDEMIRRNSEQKD